MEIYQELAKLTDPQAERCLNSVVAGYSAQKGHVFKKLVAQKEEMAEAVRSTAAQVNVPLARVGEVPAEQKPEAIRVVLVEMAAIPELSQEIASWIESDRKTLLEPVTSALVLAGIVLILSLEVDITYKEVDGKRTIDVHVKKPSVPPKILEKIASFF